MRGTFCEVDARKLAAPPRPRPPSLIEFEQATDGRINPLQSQRIDGAWHALGEPLLEEIDLKILCVVGHPPEADVFERGASFRPAYKFDDGRANATLLIELAEALDEVLLHREWDQLVGLAVQREERDGFP